MDGLTNVRWYSLEEFAAAIKPASWSAEPLTWDVVVAQMLLCPFDVETIDILRKDRRTDGNFREPVVVVDGQVANGMHRSVACILEGLPIPVQEGFGPDKDTHYIDVSFSCVSLDGKETEESQDLLFCALRSFHLGDQMWVETDVMSGWANDMNAAYTCCESGKDQLFSMMKERALRIGFQLTVKEYRSATMDELYGDESE